MAALGAIGAQKISGDCTLGSATSQVQQSQKLQFSFLALEVKE
jgi:hypothetical protein